MIAAFVLVSLLAQAPLPEGHPPVQPGTSQAPSADDLIRQLDASPGLKEREKTFEVAVGMGKVYYVRGRFGEAITFLRQALEKGAPARALHSELAHKKAGSCPAEKQTSLDATVAFARGKLKAGDAATAASCARDALKPVLDAQLMLAQALFINGEPTQALKEIEQVLAADESHADSLYARASILLETRGDDVKALRQAKRDWQKYTGLAAGTARAANAQKLMVRVDDVLAAGGLTAYAKKKAAEPVKIPPAPTEQQGPPALTREMIDAVQNTERTPELEQGLSKLVDEGEAFLAKSQYQEALDAYKRVVPFQPENGRARAGMAWALVGLNKQPMADRVWSVAVTSDPAAVEKLGEALKAKGDEKGAKALWTKLAQSSPAQAEKLKSKLQ